MADGETGVTALLARFGADAAVFTQIPGEKDRDPERAALRGSGEERCRTLLP